MHVTNIFLASLISGLAIFKQLLLLPLLQYLFLDIEWLAFVKMQTNPF